jgi:deoxyribose-phosphate aldolase
MTLLVEEKMERERGQHRRRAQKHQLYNLCITNTYVRYHIALERVELKSNLCSPFPIHQNQTSRSIKVVKMNSPAKAVAHRMHQGYRART